MDWAIWGPQESTEQKVIRCTPVGDALYKADIAKDAMLPTKVVLRILKRLEKRRVVVRVLDGSPASWRKA